jgi:hypothetical protein
MAGLTDARDTRPRGDLRDHLLRRHRRRRRLPLGVRDVRQAREDRLADEAGDVEHLRDRAHGGVRARGGAGVVLDTDAEACALSAMAYGGDAQGMTYRRRRAHPM